MSNSFFTDSELLGRGAKVIYKRSEITSVSTKGTSKQILVGGMWPEEPQSLAKRRFSLITNSYLDLERQNELGFASNQEILRKRSLRSIIVNKFKQESPEKSQNYPSTPPQGNPRKIDKAFNNFRLVLLALGRFPFAPERIPSPPLTPIDVKIDLGVSYAYKDRLLSLPWVYFLLSSLLLLLIFISSTFGFIGLFLGWEFLSLPQFLTYSSTSSDSSSSLKLSESDLNVIKSHLVPFVLFWSCLVHASVSNVSFLRRRKLVVKSLNYWNEAFDLLEMGVPKSIGFFLLGSNLWFGVFLIIVLYFYLFSDVAIARGGAALIGILTFRHVAPHIHLSPHFWKIRIFGIIIMMYSIYASRVYLLLFSFKCRLLRHAIQVWNERLKKELSKSITNTESPSQIKGNCERLFRDHGIIIKLVRNTDDMFAHVLQAYYASQILNLCFELYYLARSGDLWQNNDGTQSDLIAALIVLIQNVGIFYTLSIDASYVNEEAIRGFEILRMRGVYPEDNISKKYLFHNLQLSFSKRIVLTGGRYFKMDRAFIVHVLGAVLTYFVIVLQLQPNITQNEVNGKSNVSLNILSKHL